MYRCIALWTNDSTLIYKKSKSNQRNNLKNTVFKNHGKFQLKEQNGTVNMPSTIYVSKELSKGLEIFLHGSNKNISITSL